MLLLEPSQILTPRHTTQAVVFGMIVIAVCSWSMAEVKRSKAQLRNGWFYVVVTEKHKGKPMENE